MLGEAVMGLSALNTAFNMAKGLKDMSDAAIRNAAVIELQENILAAQQAQAALIKRIGDLEKEMARFETWEAQKQRYQMKDFGGGTIAYELKPAEASGSPRKPAENQFIAYVPPVMRSIIGRFSSLEVKTPINRTCSNAQVVK